MQDREVSPPNPLTRSTDPGHNTRRPIIFATSTSACFLDPNQGRTASTLHCPKTLWAHAQPQLSQHLCPGCPGPHWGGSQQWLWGGDRKMVMGEEPISWGGEGSRSWTVGNWGCRFRAWNTLSGPFWQQALCDGMGQGPVKLALMLSYKNSVESGNDQFFFFWKSKLSGWNGFSREDKKDANKAGGALRVENLESKLRMQTLACGEEEVWKSWDQGSGKVPGVF